MKRLFALSILLGILGLNARAATVAFYGFEGTGTAAPGATITDSTGNHPGTVQGGDLLYGTDPLVGGYLSFDPDATGAANTGDRVVVAGAWDLVFTIDQAYTIEVIFRSSRQGTFGALISKGADVSNPDSQWWLRHTDAGRFQGLVEGKDNTTEDSATASVPAQVTDGKWHHVALVYNGTGASRRLDVYVDGVWEAADTAIGTLGVIGGVDTDPVIIGEFASGASARTFGGDIAAVRLSDTALTPAEFLQRDFTWISNVTPTNKSSFLAPTTVASFVVNSPSIGVPAANIQVLLNGIDLSGQLSLAGTDSQRTVTLPALAANELYTMVMQATDNAGNAVTQTSKFNTFVNNLLFVEGEDYNFESGGFIDNPPLTSTPSPNSYLDRSGVEGVDYHQTNTTTSLYRFTDIVGTAVSTDTLRQAYIDAQVTDPGVNDYMSTGHANSEWLNYTRNFPAANYRVYARLAKSGTVPVVIQVDEVTSGSTTPTQTVEPVGFFRRSPSSAANDFDFVPLTDAIGNEIALPLSSTKTFRLTMVSGTANLNFNYVLFVPYTGVQRPFLASVSPAAGEGNAAFNSPIQATIRSGDATVTTGTIQLKLDGADVSENVVSTSTGASVSYSPSVMSTSLHTATLIFTDSTATTTTNQWQFYVANQAVRGLWNFNEQTAGNTVSTIPGAISDASGNSRNGSAAAAGQAYAPGSFNFGNTPALSFTAGPDRVVVPDASGNFNFTGSFTMEAVVRVTNTATSAAILAKNGTGDGEGEYWWRAPGATGGKQRFWMNGQGVAGTNATINDGNWHHLAVVYDQSAAQLRLYADYLPDAVLDNIIVDRPVGRPADLQIGGFIASTGSEFVGDIDLVRISDGALAPAQFVQATIALQPLVKSVTPVDGARNAAPDATIQAEILNRDTAVVLGTLKLFIDGNDVTAGSTKTPLPAGATISYSSTSGLANGMHTAKITFNDTAVPANSWTNSWSFTVASSIPVLAFYQFNEKSAGAEADSTPDAIRDGSGKGHHLTAAGSPLPLYGAGSANYGSSSALTFTSLDDRVYTTESSAFNFGPEDSFTLEAVIRPAFGTTTSGNIVGRDWGSGLPSWWFRLEGGVYPRFYLEGGGSATCQSSIPVNDGEWHHVAAVRDALANKVRVYVDYVLAAEVPDTLTLGPTNAQNLIIGAFNNGDATRQFEGDIDLVRIIGEAVDSSWFVPLGGLASSFKLVDTGLVGNNITFSFQTENGRTYVVESTDTLGATWSFVENVPGDGTVKTRSYPATGSSRFYHVKTQ